MYSLMKQYKLISSDSPQSQSRMCFRILVNSFSAEVSRSAMMDIREELISILNTLLEDSEDEISPQVIKYKFSEEIFCVKSTTGNIFNYRLKMPSLPWFSITQRQLVILMSPMLIKTGPHFKLSLHFPLPF